MIEKSAKGRGKRKEQEQEAIVALKDNINERTTALIKLLKAVKSGWNGGPSPDIGINEKINLTQPLPDEIAQSGDKALQELQSIIQGLHQVDHMQDQYAEGKKKKMEERLHQIQSRMQTVQSMYEEVIRKNAIHEALKKEASNKLTRIWSHIVAPFASERGRGERLEMLRGLARLERDLGDVEEAVISGDNAILDAVHLAKQFYQEAKASFFDSFRINLQNMLSATKQEVSNLQKEVKEIQEELKKGKFEIAKDVPPTVETPPTIGKPPSPTTPGKPPTFRKVPFTTQKSDQPPQPDQPVPNDQTQAQQVAQQTSSKPVEDVLKTIMYRLDGIEGRVTQVAPVIGQPSRRSRSTQTPQPPVQPPVQTPPSVTPPVQTPPTSPAQPDLPDDTYLPDYDPDYIPDYIDPDQYDFDVPNAPDVSGPPDVSTPPGPDVSIPLTPDVSIPLIDDLRVKAENFSMLLWTNANVLSDELSDQLLNQKFPSPWKERIHKQLNVVKDAYEKLRQVLKSRFVRKNYFKNCKIEYLKFIKSIADVKASLDAYLLELEESKNQPNFIWGSSIDESRLENEARTFLIPHTTQLKSMSYIYSNAKLVSFGSRFSRFMKRMLQNVSGGRDKSIRLRADQHLREARKGIQNLMNILEKRHINFRYLISSSNLFLNGIANAYEKLADLADSYNSRLKMERAKNIAAKHRVQLAFIQEGDIRVLRNIRKYLIIDSQIINELEKAESTLSEQQALVDELKNHLTLPEGEVKLVPSETPTTKSPTQPLPEKSARSHYSPKPTKTVRDQTGAAYFSPKEEIARRERIRLRQLFGAD